MLAGPEDLKDEEVDLYENLKLLHALDPFQGLNHVNRQDKKCDDRYTSQELRRSFLDGISYLCDIDPQGGTVTAGAMCEVSPNALLYLAANESIKARVRKFVKWVLQVLKDVSMNNRQEQEEKILRRAVKNAHLRMDSYRRKMLFHLQKCRAVIGGDFEGKKDVSSKYCEVILT
jgi:hypothetical protein